MSGNGNVDQNSADSNWDYLHVSVLRASLEEPKTGASNNGGCCYFHPYVILEMDHPAQRHRTARAKSHKSRSSRGLPGPGSTLPQRPSIDFTWPESHFKL